MLNFAIPVVFFIIPLKGFSQNMVFVVGSMQQDFS